MSGSPLRGTRGKIQDPTRLIAARRGQTGCKST